ncbi:hypothetical protein ACVWZM_006521 [Bradyrhizobium sp. USDA 4501]
MRLSKSIACPVADLMVPALSTENLAAVVLLLPDAPLIWMASSADWIVAPALLTTDSEITLLRLVVARIARDPAVLVASIMPELVIVVVPPPIRITSLPDDLMMPPLWLVIENTVVFDVALTKSKTRPLPVDWMVPALSTVTDPLLRPPLIRNASLDAVKSAPELLISVRLPLMALLEVSMPREVAEMVPLLVMTTPGDDRPVIQVIAVPVTDRLLPAATEPVSLLETVCAVVLLGAVLKLAASAGQENPNEVAEIASASRLARLRNSDFT